MPGNPSGEIGMKRYIVRLSEEERAKLSALVSKGKTAARKRLHAQVLLKADISAAGAGWTDRQIVQALDVGERTVQAIRQRCVEEGLEAALERKPPCRPSRQRILDGAKEAQLVALCCGKIPAGQARWTLRLLADELVRLEMVESVSHETVRRTLKKTI
jgi:transposase